MMKNMRKAFTLLLCFIILLQFTGCASFYRGPKLNLDGYELVFFDDFKGDELNLDLWEYRKNGSRRSGYNHPDQVRVENGNLIFTGEHTTNEYGEGWYAGMIALKEMYTYGYFEIRCQPNKSEDFWSAFWLTCEGVYLHDISQGGIYGAEVDVFETFKNPGIRNQNMITSCIHCNGSDNDPDNIDSLRVTKTYIPRLREKYTTFGLLWTEEEYIFYVNGKETARSSFGKGTSTVPLQVILSLEIPDEFNLDKSTVTEYLVDYVKIYQLQK